MWKREKVGSVVALLLMAVLGACQGRSANVSNSAVVPTRVVTDDLGRNVTVPVKITRVVSLAPNLTENIFAVGAGDRLVGVTTFCNYPEQAKSIAKIGDTMTPNMESIIALKPDVVFVSTASQIEAFMKTLESNGIAVYVTNPVRLGDVFHNLEQFGIIFGTDETATSLISELSRREKEVREKCGTVPVRDGDEYTIKPVRVFVQISKEPLFTIGRSSFVNAIVRSAGGILVTDNIDDAYPKLSKETALALRPDTIILSDSPDNQEPNEAFRNSPAVKNGRVYKVNADLLSRPGPRLVNALEQIARYLHPDKFGQTER